MPFFVYRKARAVRYEKEGAAMLFIISPAKKMVDAADSFAWQGMPCFLPQTCELLEALRALSYDEAKALWKCSDTLADLNYERVRSMDPMCGAACAPAVFSYEGIQYQNMAPQVMTDEQLDYLQRHLRILSGFYGVLRPFDAVVPYRLEMQAELAVGGARDLYGYWGSRLYEALAGDLARQICETESTNAGGAFGRDGDRSKGEGGGADGFAADFCRARFDVPDRPGALEERVIVNLASVEYAKAVLPHAKAAVKAGADVRVLTCLFGTVRDGKFVQRSTEAKAARGTFVRWCAENSVAHVADFKRFDASGYTFDQGLSTNDSFVFVK